jgi:hypothetical protein
VNVAIIISAISVGIALASLLVNFVLSRRSSIRARKPILVFVDDPDEECWALQNLGNGPALNVLVAQRAGGRWFNPVRLAPLAKDGSFSLRWLGRVDDTGLGASYADFEGRRYTSTLGGEISRAFKGDRLPRWDDSEIVRYWELPAQDERGRWGAKPSDFGA